MTLETSRELLLLDINNEILGLHVARNVKGDVELGNGLGPFVRKRILFLLLLETSGGVLCGSRFCKISTKLMKATLHSKYARTVVSHSEL